MHIYIHTRAIRIDNIVHTGKSEIRTQNKFLLSIKKGYVKKHDNKLITFEIIIRIHIIILTTMVNGKKKNL